MNKPSVLCVVLCIGLSNTAALPRGGGMGSYGGMGSQMSTTDGALSTSAVTPGTNSLGTALSSRGIWPWKRERHGTSHVHNWRCLWH
jgi:hypothetical protein